MKAILNDLRRCGIGIRHLAVMLSQEDKQPICILDAGSFLGRAERRVQPSVLGHAYLYGLSYARAILHLTMIDKCDVAFFGKEKDTALGDIVD